MKKIVALALCLVLALSLCATAFAATKIAGTFDYKDASTLTGGDTNVELYKTAAVKATKAAGGDVEYYQLATDTALQKYVKVTDSEDADVVVYKADKTDVYMYLAKADSVHYAYATEVTKLANMLGDGCEQYDADAYEDYTFYSYKDAAGKVTYVCNDGDMDPGEGDYNLLVNGELVAVKVVGGAVAMNGHDWEEATWNADETKVKTYKCAECGKIATVVANAASVPTGAVSEVISGKTVWYMPDAVKAAATTTTGVSSAKTFDAGIALYVGMSISAVAGSAVVIGKKKEF